MGALGKTQDRFERNRAYCWWAYSVFAGVLKVQMRADGGSVDEKWGYFKGSILGSVLKHFTGNGQVSSTSSHT